MSACKSLRMGWPLTLGSLTLLLALTGADGVTSAFAQTPPPPLPAVAGTPATLVASVPDKKSVMELLGQWPTLLLLLALTALIGAVYYIFMDLGRRLQDTGYLGKLASEAIANAEIARREKQLRDQLARGEIGPGLEPTSDDFKKRYEIPLDALAPEMPPGVILHEYDRSMEFVDGGRTSIGNALPGDENEYFRHQREILEWKGVQLEAEQKRLENRREELRQRSASNPASPAQELEGQLRQIERAIEILKSEVERRFLLGFRKEQLRTFQQVRKTIKKDEEEHASKILSRLDTSTFSGSWIYLLEFTTIVFIVYAVLSLGVLGVLDSQPIATILAAVAGYVLGKSTTLRGAAGEEVRRGAEEPKALLELLAKQEGARSSRDAEKTRLQQDAEKKRGQIEELQQKLAQTTVVVPDLAKLPSSEAEKVIRERNLVPEKTEVENSRDAGKVFLQEPRAGVEVPKGNIVHIFVAKIPA
jgi:hypothetical protein